MSLAFYLIPCGICGKIIDIIYILGSLNSSSITCLVCSVLALEATEPVSEPVTQMAVELINNHLISVQQKR